MKVLVECHVLHPWPISGFVWRFRISGWRFVTCNSRILENSRLRRKEEKLGYYKATWRNSDTRTDSYRYPYRYPYRYLYKCLYRCPYRYPTTYSSPLTFVLNLKHLKGNCIHNNQSHTKKKEIAFYQKSALLKSYATRDLHMSEYPHFEPKANNKENSRFTSSLKPVCRGCSLGSNSSIPNSYKRSSSLPIPSFLLQLFFKTL